MTGAAATYPVVEPHVGRLVADHLGVELASLRRHTSLRDDLAADSLDMLELGLALESRFGIDVSDRLLERVRSYGELVEATVRLIRRRR
jgi:acyl carrier protein